MTALARTARRYAGCSRFTRVYVACKLRMDPVHAAVLRLAAATPFGTVLDAGCGLGQLGVALLEAGGAAAVLAVDRKPTVLAELRKAGAGLPLEVQAADLSRLATLPPADTVLLVDVLYQFTTDAQLAVLRNAADLARHRVVVRATDPAAGWRSRVAAAMERAGRHWWFTFGERANPLPLGQLTATLTGCGFLVARTPCAEGTPLAGVLLVATRVPARCA